MFSSYNESSAQPKDWAHAHLTTQPDLFWPKFEGLQHQNLANYLASHPGGKSRVDGASKSSNDSSPHATQKINHFQGYP